MHKNTVKRRVNYILKTRIKHCTKEILKTTKIIAVALILIIGIILIKYKPLYKVEIDGVQIGYVKNKKEFNSLVNEYVESEKNDQVAFVTLDSNPSYELKLVENTIDSNENEVLETVKENTTTIVITDKVESNVNIVNYQVKVTANSGLNIRAGASTAYARIGGYAKGTVVTILAESNGFGKTNLGWISLAYTSRDISTLNIQNTVGNIKRLSRASILYSNSNLTGYKYNYKANTTITILQNISSTVDKVRVNVTGRIAYINNSNYTNITVSKTKSTTRKTKACTLYSKSNLSGVRYQYKANTTVTVLQHINSYVDKVRVNATGRIAYINVNNYR
mgnify:CR=1 FL=1